MFFNRIPKKPNRAQHMIGQYQRGIKENAQHRRYYFPMLYSALFCSPSPEQIRYISHEAETLIKGKDAFFVANLMHGYYEYIADADTDAWKQACSPDGCRALLICGAAHPNGYFREQCLKLLANERGVLPYILMRMNEEDAVVLRKRLSANEQAQLSILDLHQKLDQIQTRYHL